jgi:hypothetical protein
MDASLMSLELYERGIHGVTGRALRLTRFRSPGHHRYGATSITLKQHSRDIRALPAESDRAGPPRITGPFPAVLAHDHIIVDISA